MQIAEKTVLITGANRGVGAALAKEALNMSSHPCLPCCWCRCKQQGPFTPRTLPRFTATAGPSVTLSPSPDFPVYAGYTGSCSVDFATGRGGLLQLLGVSLPSCCRYRPARVSRRIGQFATCHAAFALPTRARPLGCKVSRSVAVGTAVARCPPHGPVLAQLAHTVLTLDVWRRSVH